MRWLIRRYAFGAAAIAGAALAAELPSTARPTGPHIGAGPDSNLVFAYTAPDALFITVEHYPAAGPVQVLLVSRQSSLAPGSAVLGSLDCILEGLEKATLVAEVMASDDSENLVASRAWKVSFDPLSVSPVDARRVRCRNPKKGTP